VPYIAIYITVARNSHNGYQWLHYHMYIKQEHAHLDKNVQSNYITSHTHAELSTSLNNHAPYRTVYRTVYHTVYRTVYSTANSHRISHHMLEACGLVAQIISDSRDSVTGIMLSVRYFHVFLVTDSETRRLEIEKFSRLRPPVCNSTGDCQP
jgi:hypothetical protein